MAFDKGELVKDQEDVLGDDQENVLGDGTVQTIYSDTEEVPRRQSGKVSGVGALFRRPSMQHAGYLPPESEIDFVLETFPKAGTTEFNVRVEAELKRTYGQIKELQKQIFKLQYQSEQQQQSLQAQSSYINQDLLSTLCSHQERLQELEQAVQRLQKAQKKNSEATQKIAEKAGVSDILAKDTLENAEEELLSAIAELMSANDKATIARAEAKESSGAAIKNAEALVDEKTMAYLRIKAQQKFASKAEPKLPMVRITNLQAQLAENIRQGLADKPAAGWSWRTMFSTDKNTRALNSVRALSKNAAFSMDKDRKKDELEVNAEILELMMLASYALSDFGKIFAVMQPGATSDSEDEESDTHQRRGVFNTPASQQPLTPSRRISPINVSSSARRSAAKSVAQANELEDQVVRNAEAENAISQAVVDVIRKKLANIQTKAGGLLGTQNPTMQFWGKVLMALALAIAVTLAAAALMSTLGVATPAFLVPYFAAVKASAIVSTVLNFVAAKLTLDLNTAAVVSVAATAGAFGVFGKGLHVAGGPNNFKRSLDKAAQDMEAALADTETAKYKPGM